MSGTVVNLLILSFLSFSQSLLEFEEVDVSGTALSTTIDDYNGIDTMTTCDHGMLTRYLKSLGELNSDLVEVRSIGKSTRRKELWNVVITFNKENVGRKKQIKFVGNINGFSGPACVILVRFAKYLVDEARRDNKTGNLFKWAEVHIVANLNPDGYEKSRVGDCGSAAGWKNGDGITLNRNFPNPYSSSDANEIDDVVAPAMETFAVQRWIEENDFAISASLISGTKALIYPYDMAPSFIPNGAPFQVPPPDQLTFFQMCEDYATGVDGATKGSYTWDCPTSARGEKGRKMINMRCINGAEYGRAEGTMADYNYEQGVMELTIGLDCCRNLNDERALESIYKAHIEGLFGIVLDGVFSLRMRIVDSMTGGAVEGANVKIFPLVMLEEAEHRVWSFRARHGVLVRMLPPGEYKIEVWLQGYENKELNLTVPFEPKIDEFPPVELEKIRSKSFESGRRINGNSLISFRSQEVEEARESFYPWRGEGEKIPRTAANQETSSGCGQVLVGFCMVASFAMQAFLGYS